MSQVVANRSCILCSVQKNGFGASTEPNWKGLRRKIEKIHKTHIFAQKYGVAKSRTQLTFRAAEFRRSNLTADKLYVEKSKPHAN